MKKSQIITTVTGGSFIILGLLLLGTLVDLFERSMIYGWTVPAVFIFSGFSIVQDAVKPKHGLGYSLIAVGAVGLLVRLNIVSGDVINALLGAALLCGGSIIVSKALKPSETQ